MSDTLKCPQCGSENPYQDRALWVCPDCAHEWSEDAAAAPIASDGAFRDSNGNLLVAGDTVALIKDLKVKGSSSTVKNGTKIKNIRLLTEPVDGHDIACKIDGLGTIYLKSEFVRKA